MVRRTWSWQHDLRAISAKKSIPRANVGLSNVLINESVLASVKKLLSSGGLRAVPRYIQPERLHSSSGESLEDPTLYDGATHVHPEFRTAFSLYLGLLVLWAMIRYLFHD